MYPLPNVLTAFNIGNSVLLPRCHITESSIYNIYKLNTNFLYIWQRMPSHVLILSGW